MKDVVLFGLILGLCILNLYFLYKINKNDERVDLLEKWADYIDANNEVEEEGVIYLDDDLLQK